MSHADVVSGTDVVLLGTRRAGPYHLLTIRAADVVAAATPGQFVSLGVDAPHAVLRRPFAIAGTDPRVGTLDLAVAVVGVGSAWLVDQPGGRRLDVVGPLGRGFVMPAPGRRCVLVGGGYGTAALGWLGQRLSALGRRTELLSGAATASALYPTASVAGVVGTLIETTEDGSRGRSGLVTDVLGARLDAAGDATVFACGPMPMLAAVARIAAAHGVPCQVAVEEHMACGVGVCMTCVVPTRTDGYLRACIAGPVMDASAIDWETVTAWMPPRNQAPRRPAT